jgi:ribosome silencing factor RsfS/YbeB/iojap
MPKPPPRPESTAPSPGERGAQGFPTRSTTPLETIRAFAIESARLLADDKCEDVVVLDVRELSQVADFIVIGSGTSERQMNSVLTHVRDLGDEMGFPSYRASTDERSTWLLADFVDVVVHVFEPNTRAHYDLEMLWGDAERIPWEREAGATPRGRRGPPGLRGSAQDAP